MSDSSEEGQQHITIHSSAPPPPPSVDDSYDHTEHELKSCCCGGQTTDKRLYILVTQSVMSACVLALCLYRLSDPNMKCEGTATYMSLLTLVIGYWCKSPLDK